jgi:Tol biopolymer transport system component
MPDLEGRFRLVKEARPPDLWPEIARRAPTTRRSRLPWQRIGVATVAFVVAAASIALLTRSFLGGRRPAVAPPAQKIAFVSWADSDIHVMNPDGTGGSALVSGPTVDTFPTWSPDGSRIAFVREISKAESELYVMNADGTGVTLIKGDWQGSEPAWSPDGSRFAYYCACSGAIHVMNSDGTGDRRFTESTATGNPAWSPDGSKIAFEAAHQGNDEIFVMNADGSGLERLTDDPRFDLYPSWSPDGSRIAFSRIEGGNENIYVMNADGSSVSRLTDHPAEDSAPAWSPDGAKIAFTRPSPGGVPQIHLMNADGSGETQLTHSGEGAYEPAWQPAPRPEPQLAGSVTLTTGVAAGQPWELKANPGPAGLVLTLQGPTRSAALDGVAVPEEDLQATTLVFGSGESAELVAFGAVSLRVARVEVFPAYGGPAVTADVLEVPDSINPLRNAFAVVADADFPATINAYDADGKVVARIPLLAGPEDREVARLVEAFLQARVERSGAEPYVARGAADRFGPPGRLGALSPLYDSRSDGPYVGFEIVFVDGPLAPEGSFEVGVRLDVAGEEGWVEETLFVGPGVDELGEKRSLLVVGPPGLGGPVATWPDAQGPSDRRTSKGWVDYVVLVQVSASTDRVSLCHIPPEGTPCLRRASPRRIEQYGRVGCF